MQATRSPNFIESKPTVESPRAVLLGESRRRVSFLFAYLLFGFGAPLFATFVLLPMSLTRSSVEQRRKAAFRAVNFYLRLLKTLELCQVEVEGAAPNRPCVIVFNHPTVFDALLVLREFPTAACVVKAELLSSKAYGLAIRLLGFISAQSGLAVVREGTYELSRGNSVVIFPSGTRVAQLGKLRRSAARLALEAEVPVSVGFISVDPPVLGKDVPWYQPPASRVRISLKYLEPIEIRKDARPLGIQSRELNAKIQERFEEALLNLSDT